MTNIFKNTKFLFAGTVFIISWKDKKLWEIKDREHIDWSDYVINWKPFSNIIRVGCEDHEKITLDFWHDNKKLVFFNLALGMSVCVDADLVIQNKSLKEENEMDDEQGELKMSKEKIKVTSAEIIVNVKGDSKKPYYEIKYLEIGKDKYAIGYGSYKLDFVTDWYNNCFEIVTEELTPAERIRQLEEERTALGLQIKNQEKYDEIRKIGDELAIYMKAIQDSGFSREEAMQIFMMTSMNAKIPPFLRG